MANKKITIKDPENVILHPETVADNVKVLTYAKAESSEAITSSDDVATALGKLEYKVDTNAISGVRYREI